MTRHSNVRSSHL